MKTYGQEPNQNPDNFDPEIYQHYSNTCAIRAQQIIARDYGYDIPQEQLMAYAETKGYYRHEPSPGSMYDDSGSNREHVGCILKDLDIPVKHYKDATLFDLVNELSQGHRCMVTLDADELWADKEGNLVARLKKQFQNQVDDLRNSIFGVEGDNHALIIAGIQVNPDDPADIRVIITDSGTGEVCVSYTMKQFMDAWKDGGYNLVATQAVAPYQYNYETHQMEPSGFETDFHASLELPDGLENHFSLPENYFEMFANRATISRTLDIFGWGVEPADEGNSLPDEASTGDSESSLSEHESDSLTSEDEQYAEPESADGSDYSDRCSDDTDIDGQYDETSDYGTEYQDDDFNTDCN